MTDALFPCWFQQLSATYVGETPMNLQTGVEGYPHTVESISKNLGIPLRLVREYRKTFDEVFEAHVLRGERGRYFLSNNAFSIFKHIKDLQIKGMPKSAIVRMITEDAEKSENSHETGKNSHETDVKSGRESEADFQKSGVNTMTLFLEEKKGREQAERELRDALERLAEFRVSQKLLEDKTQRIVKEKQERLRMLEDIEKMVPWWRRNKWRQLRMEIISLDMEAA